ncbi:MAG: agmatine deiminase family protein [Pseudomonadota bacterium]
MSEPPAGFLMPAEWARHRATWLVWPHNDDDWPGKFEPIPWVYGEIVRQLCGRERVVILVENPGIARRAWNLLRKVGVDKSGVDYHVFPTDRSWIRDTGPLFVKDRRGLGLAATAWRFNGWAKYDNWERDNQVSSYVASVLGLAIHRPRLNGRPVVLEGGAIDVDGEGSMLATEECLLSSTQQRNPGLERKDYERIVAEYLGVRTVVWLGRGIAGDDTHGHVDDVCRFVAPGRVVLAVEDDVRDPNYIPLEENRERLEVATDAQGRRLEVIRLPMPEPCCFEGQRLPVSYVNFYVANGVVLVPTFNSVRDRMALGILAELFPDHQVVGIHALDLAWGLGTLHCSTLQEPARASDKDLGRQQPSGAAAK